MAHKAIVYSVPGTGTRFCNRFLENVLGYKATSKVQLVTGVGNNYILMHTVNESKHDLTVPLTNLSERAIDKLIHKATDIKLVAPLRDPYLSYITRLKYDMPHSSEGKQTMINYWKIFIEKTAQYSTVFVPVDCMVNDRPKILHSIAQHLGAQVPRLTITEYVKEWPKVGTLGNSKLKDEYITHGTIDGTKPTFLDFVVRWQTNRKQK